MPSAAWPGSSSSRTGKELHELVKGLFGEAEASDVWGHLPHLLECGCLGVPISCGHCLWYMGGLQCLL